MTKRNKIQIGASSSCLQDWKAIDWQKVLAHVRRLQLRIAKAYQEGKYGKVKALQWTLTHSYYAKLLSVRRVTQNKGGKTPGVDGIIWKTPREKIKAAGSLKRRGYKTKPLRRIYIPKKQKGKRRPLSIPTMYCRAQQALYLLALEPIAEWQADKNAYGFRPLRSTADAIEQGFKALVRKTGARYILEGDIQDCFGSISSQWLLQNTLMDKTMLRKWLAAGYIEKGKLYPTERGTPQGGTISPALLVVVLSGLERAVEAVTTRTDKVHVCIYADDFIITGATREVLESKVKPAVEAFLGERGLRLSQEKTKIAYIKEGFDFLGMNIRKYGREGREKLLIKPAKSSIKRFLSYIREIVKLRATDKTEGLISTLNPKIQGWAGYYRHVVSKETYNYVDYKIFEALWRWASRRHPNKGSAWVRKRYYRRDQLRNWVLYAKVKHPQGSVYNLDLVKASDTPIRRHVKIQAEATPFNPAYHDYFNERILKRKGEESVAKLDWWLCWWNLLNERDTGKFGSPKAALLKARAV
jgi:RNA-directed DNA polymerase